MRGIDEETLLAVRKSLAADGLNTDVIDALISLKVQELQEPWMALDEFLKSGFEGKCWLGNDISGAVICAHYYSGAFCEDSSSCGSKYISAQSITHVQPIHKPEPPKL